MGLSGTRRAALTVLTMVSSVFAASLGSAQAAPAVQSPPAQSAPGQSPSHQPPATGSSSPSPVAEPGATPSGDRQNAAPPASSDQPPSGQEPSGNDSGMFVFKKQVEEVVLHATVVDAQQRLVTNLDKNNFSVSENGVAQTITSFRREDVPVEIGIVVDNSGSMRDKRQQVEDAVLELVRASNPQDQVFVVNFGSNPYLDQDFTGDVNLLQAALHQVSAKGSTALYDAVSASAVHLEHNPKLSKKVLLVITDGRDNMSRETLQETLRRLQQPDGPTLYAIGLLSEGMQGQGREALQELAGGTGGVAYFPDSLDQVNQIARTVAHDIRSQYVIAFRPQNQNLKPEYQTLQVNASAPGYTKLTVSTRSGYFATNAAAH